MKLTGKCKDNFENWYEVYIRNTRSDYDRYHISQVLRKFNRKHLAEQWGVYIDFFDSKDIYIWTGHNEVARKFYYSISTKPMSNDIGSKHNLTRIQAREAAITKANKIYNEK